MKKIILAKEGVFPITKDGKGNALSHIPATGMPFSGTVQGEGMLAGIPSLFIRLSGCNLQCMWSMSNGEYSGCDTAYASFHAVETIKTDTQEVVDIVRHNLGNLRHVVITGGEPMLQKEAVADLCRMLKEFDGLHITMESNGTIFDPQAAQYIDLFSISPKLSNSNPDAAKLAHFNLREKPSIIDHHSRQRININAIQQFINFANDNGRDLQLKFVTGHRSDLQEIKEQFLTRLTGWNPRQILVMPLGGTREHLAISAPIALEMAITNGWRYAPRIHIDLFGSKSGV
jgi:7-carboxy-7-deazaguanine synthase